MFSLFRRTQPPPPPINPSDVGRILGVNAFTPGDLVFLNDHPYFVATDQPHRNLGFVTVCLRAKHYEIRHQHYPSELSFPPTRSLWSQHQHLALEEASTRQRRWHTPPYDRH